MAESGKNPTSGESSNEEKPVGSNEYFVCDLCPGRRWITAESLANHKKREHSGEIFYCVICHREFQNQEEYDQHNLEEHPAPDTAEPDEKRTSAPTFEHLCFYCPACFSTQLDLDYHVANFHIDDGLQPGSSSEHRSREPIAADEYIAGCPIEPECQLGSSPEQPSAEPVVVDVHIAGSHTEGERELGSVPEHPNTESIVNPDECVICPRNYEQGAISIREHYDSVHGFFCPICGGPFRYQAYLFSHMMTDHHDREYDNKAFCPFCDEPQCFRDSLDFSQHCHRSHPIVSRFHCHTCKREFQTEELFNEHLDLYHKKVTEPSAAGGSGRQEERKNSGTEDPHSDSKKTDEGCSRESVQDSTRSAQPLPSSSFTPQPVYATVTQAVSTVTRPIYSTVTQPVSLTVTRPVTRPVSSTVTRPGTTSATRPSNLPLRLSDSFLLPSGPPPKKVKKKGTLECKKCGASFDTSAEKALHVCPIDSKQK